MSEYELLSPVAFELIVSDDTLVGVIILTIIEGIRGGANWFSLFVDTCLGDLISYPLLRVREYLLAERIWSRRCAIWSVEETLPPDWEGCLPYILREFIDTRVEKTLCEDLTAWILFRNNLRFTYPSPALLFYGPWINHEALCLVIFILVANSQMTISKLSGRSKNTRSNGKKMWRDILNIMLQSVLNWIRRLFGVKRKPTSTALQEWKPLRPVDHFEPDILLKIKSIDPMSVKKPRPRKRLRLRTPIVHSNFYAGECH